MLKNFLKMLLCLAIITSVALSALACEITVVPSTSDDSTGNSSSSDSGSSADSSDSSHSGSDSSDSSDSSHSGSDSSDSSSSGGSSSGEVHLHEFKVAVDEDGDTSIVSYVCKCGVQSPDRIQVISLIFSKNSDKTVAEKSEIRYSADADGKVRLPKSAISGANVEKAYVIDLDRDGEKIGTLSDWSGYY